MNLTIRQGILALGLLAMLSCRDGTLKGEASQESFGHFFDPEAAILMPLSPVRAPQKLRAFALPARGGETLILAQMEALDFNASKLPEGASLAAFLSSTGQVRRVPSGPETNNKLFVSRFPPHAVPLDRGVLVTTCTPEENHDLVPMDGTAPVSLQLGDIGYCSTSNPFGALRGAALGDRFIVGRLHPTELSVVVYTLSGTTAEVASSFGVPNTGLNALLWIEEIAAGVVAWAGIANANPAEGTPERWVYGRSDRDTPLMVPTSAGTTRPRTAKDEGGIRREPDGSLSILYSYAPLHRWDVEGDGSLRAIGDALAMPPFGGFIPFAYGGALSLEMLVNPRDSSLVTPGRASARVLGPLGLELVGVRRTPCVDDATCDALGESFPLALIGPKEARQVVYAFWAWKLGEQDTRAGGVTPHLATIVSVPAVDEPPPIGAGGNGGAGGAGGTGAGGAGGAGAGGAGGSGGAPERCPAPCQGCNAAGECFEMVTNSGVVDLALGSTGLFWTGGNGRPSWLAVGASAPVEVGGAYGSSSSDRVLVAGDALYWTQAQGLSWTTTSALSTHTSISAYTFWFDAHGEQVMLGQTNGTSPVALASRYLPALNEMEILACTAGGSAGIVDPAGTSVLIASGSEVLRYALGAPRPSCGTTPSPSTSLTSGLSGVLFERLYRGETRIFAFGRDTEGMHAFELFEGAAPVELGMARSAAAAVHDDTLYFVSPNTEGRLENAAFRVLAAAPGASAPLPTVAYLSSFSGVLSALAVDSTQIVWGSPSGGVARVAR